MGARAEGMGGPLNALLKLKKEEREVKLPLSHISPHIY
jgi:hypothetical protein